MSATIEEVRPPAPPPFLHWLRQNLFNNWYNSLLTVLSLVILYFGLTGAVRWVFFRADWSPVSDNLLLYLVGQYPRDQLWRIALSVLLTSLLFGVSWGVWRGVMRSFALTLAVFYAALALLPTGTEVLTLGGRGFLGANAALVLAGYRLGRWRRITGWITLLAWVAVFLLGLVLLRGSERVPLIPPVGVNFWGGLVVTILLAVGGITLSFPIGVLLALGRRSSLPVVKLFCTVFIEVIRGVPLISILFLFSLIVPLFLPPELRIDRLLRALMAMTVFSAAYTAENVRGGLQAIPLGQIEAAKALGFNNFQTTLLIVLPQALRKVIPAIVGQFISLFKDTTLASGVAVLELLQIGRSILQANPEYIARQAEVYLFIAAVFWVFSYSMSYASRRLEVRLGVGVR